jgi:hypothetical protein
MTSKPKPENEMTSNDWYWRGYHKGEESKKERIAQLESDAIQQKVNYRKALENAKEQGKQAEYVQTINLFNKLRNTRFQFNDEVKMVIDMLKDEMTRLKSQIKKQGAK